MANEVRINVTSRDRTGPGFKSARKNANELGDSTRRIGEVAAGVLASGVFERIAFAAKEAFTSTIAAASSLEQAVGGTEAVFGSASGAIDEFAKRSADAVGLSEREFREATTLIGGQLKRMTDDVGFASDASIQLVEVGADLAATYGGTTKEAVDAFAAALRGEADPAERFNLNLKVSAVNAKAVELGLAATTSEVDDNAKAQALLALVMEQSADAQGQFARESDTHAGAQQRFTAAVEDAQAAFGQKLLPVLAAGTELATDMLAGFQKLPGPLQVVVGIIAAAAALTPGILALKAALVAMGISIRAVLLAAGPAGLALAALGTVLALVGRNSEEAEGNVEGLAQALERGTGAVTTQAREMAILELQQKGVLDTGRELGITAEDLANAWLGEEEALRRVNAALDEAIEEGTTQERIWKSRKEGISEVVQVQTDEAEAAQALKDAIAAGNITAKEAVQLAKDLGIATEDTGDAAEDAAGQVEDLKDEIKKLRDELFQTANEAIRMEEAEEGLADAIDAAKESSKDDEASKRDQRDALREVASASHDLILEMFDQGIETDKIIGKTDKARREFIDVATQMGFTQEEAEKLADKYGLIPSKVLTTVTLRDLASGDIGNIRDRLDRIDGKEARVRIINEVIENRRFNTYFSTFGTQGIGGQNAAGGNIGSPRGMQGGGPGSNRVLVGEHRPEVVDLPVGSRVIPSVDQATDRGQMDVGGGLSFTIVNRGVIGNEHELLQWLLGALDELGQQGRLAGVGL